MKKDKHKNNKKKGQKMQIITGKIIKDIENWLKLNLEIKTSELGEDFINNMISHIKECAASNYNIDDIQIAFRSVLIENYID